MPLVPLRQLRLKVDAAAAAVLYELARGASHRHTMPEVCHMGRIVPSGSHMQRHKVDLDTPLAYVINSPILCYTHVRKDGAV
jgi:hypothetical protein